MIERIKEIWQKYELGFYASITGSLVMGTIHLISTCLNFSWLTFNYMLFCYLLLLGRVLIWAVAKKNDKYLYLIGAFIILFLLVPLAVSLVRTIMEKDAPNYIFEWIIYGYATYGTYKLTYAIIRLVKSKKINNEKNVLSWLSLISALYTLFMMEFALIKTFSEDAGEKMYILMLFTQGFIILATVAVLVLFIYRFIKNSKAKEEIETNN